jgi:hypothetical protein
MIYLRKTMDKNNQFQRTITMNRNFSLGQIHELIDNPMELIIDIN